MAALIGTSETALKTEEAGFFTTHVDGYEQVFDIDTLDELTPSTFRELTMENKPTTDRQVGRLVTVFQLVFCLQCPCGRRLCIVSERTMDMSIYSSTQWETIWSA